MTRALVAGLLLAAAVGVLVLPRTAGFQRREDASDLVPGLLTVPRALRGSASLGNGVYVQLGPGGLLVNRRAGVVWQGVDRGASVTAALGRLEWRDDAAGAWDAHDGPRWRVREVVEHSLGNLTITGRTLTSRSVQYRGRVFAGDPYGELSRPISLTVTRRESDSRVLLDVQVPGADAVSLHAYRRDGWAYRGLGVQDDDDLLRDGRYPVLSRSTGAEEDAGASLAPAPVLLSSASNGLALTGSGYATFDLRHPGRVDTTTWSSHVQATLYDGTPAQLLAQRAGDVGPVHALPGWSSSGAVVGVRGSEQHVLDVATHLLDADASVAAVLVPGGGASVRYPHWDRLVDRLSSRDVRVLTTVSPALALADRPGGPAGEQQLLADARALGYLVPDATGRPVTVPVADPDRGSVPGALVDLTNPAAVRWYTGVLADRMRDERLSGWQVLGGAELPPDAHPQTGAAAAEHGTWPSRWAALTRAACERAGRPDCLLLQDTAGSRTPALTGAVGRGRQATDFSRAGLDGALAAVTNAGVSGMPFAYSAVGGTTAGSAWWGGGRHDRTDELLARWTELETFGSLLVTTDGDVPGEQPQVWDSTSRLRSFARMTRVFAALAAYRRAAVREAVRDGTPVVRPIWLSEPALAQDPASGQLMFGDSLLVAPVTRAGRDTVDVALPPGRWVELFTGAQHVVAQPRPPQGASPTATDVAVPRTVEVSAPVGRPVVLYRAADADGAAVRRALVTAGLLGAEH